MPSRKRAARKRARKHDDRGRAVDAQSKALATPEDFDREAQNPPRAVRKRNTGGGTATAQSVDEAPQDSADEAASGRRNAHDAADHAMTTRSRALTLLLGHSRTLTKKEPPYKPLRSKAIGHITPPRNLIKGDPRPRAEDLEKVAPAGARCAFTKRDNGLLSIQVSHAADRATCLVDVRLLEVMLGMEHKSLNLNTRPNLMFLTAEIHSTYDRGFCVILPSLKILGILWQALTTKTVFRFTREGRDYIFVPLLHWGNNQASIQCWTEQPDGTVARQTHDPPFMTPIGEPVLPGFTLHCCPYFVVWKAYKTLSQPDVAVPDYAAAEAELVREIGDFMRAELNADDVVPASSPSAYSPPSSPAARMRTSAR
ncbi:hypothetical protein BD626DRAFT_568822 [Schizophyllum amplum]|uniref:HNH nuclease domain-containing protein n=1 Tax=Schizophyllum amplum TaxID=97359 RepID=A0A550CF28_9AGAR|nr:hypothetical protein BD626DRAFT_568822 [Auriculariopsis ampla]